MAQNRGAYLENTFSPAIRMLICKKKKKNEPPLLPASLLVVTFQQFLHLKLGCKLSAVDISQQAPPELGQHSAPPPAAGQCLGIGSQISSSRASLS